MHATVLRSLRQLLTRRFSAYIHVRVCACVCAFICSRTRCTGARARHRAAQPTPAAHQTLVLTCFCVCVHVCVLSFAAGRGAQALVHATVLRSLRQLLFRRYCAYIHVCVRVCFCVLSFAAGRGAQALVHATVLRSLRQLLTGYPEHEDDRYGRPSSHTGLAAGNADCTPGSHAVQQQRAFALLQVQLYEVCVLAVCVCVCELC